MWNNRNIIFNGFLSGILLGIGLVNIVSDFILALILLVFVAVILTVIISLYRQILHLSIFFCIGILCGNIFAGYHQGVVNKNLQELDHYFGVYNQYTGEVVKVYRRSDYYDEYVMAVHKISSENIDGKIHHILRIPKNFVLQPKQNVLYGGVMYKLEDFNGFSYHRFMLSQDIYFKASASSIQIQSHDTDSFVYKMFILREKLLKRIENIFPQREAIFLGGILFGARENIPSELKEDFNNSGLTHFIAVSGFNITLCIIFMSYILAIFPRFIRASLVVVSIILFSLFVGLGAPVVRAAIMGILGYIFLQSGNKSSSITLIIFTAVCMCLFSPFSLNYDVSLHLSFLAVIGIIYTQELFTKLFYWLPSTMAVREAFVLTLSALSFSLPVMMFQFGQVSLLAPFANIAITWTIPLAMLAGSVTLIMDFISPILGQSVGYITWLLLRYDIAMVEFFGNIDEALVRMDFGVYANYLQVLYFIVLTYILVVVKLKSKS